MKKTNREGARDAVQTLKHLTIPMVFGCLLRCVESLLLALILQLTLERIRLFSYSPIRIRFTDFGGIGLQATAVESLDHRRKRGNVSPVSTRKCIRGTAGP